MLPRAFLKCFAGLAVGGALLAGCNSVSTPPPEIALPLAYSSAKGSSHGDLPSQSRWWLTFGDAQLNGLIDRGLSTNLDIRQAYQRLAAANASLRRAGADARPQLSVEGGYSGYGSHAAGSHDLGTRGTGSLTFNLGIDLFGRYANERKAAAARQAAAAANVQVVRLAYLADLTASYIDLQYFRQALFVANQNIASYRKTLELTRDMRTAGIATNLDVAQAQALVDAARAELPLFYKGADAAAHRIATLLDQPATGFVNSLSKKRHQPQPSGKASVLTAGVPADLLRNRPDVRREEFLLTAAAAEIGVAQAQLYPALSLTGNIDASTILATGNPVSAAVWAFGPSLLAPILDGGRLRANVDIAKADTRGQYLVWRQSVLKAVEEVETALAAVRRSQQQVQAYRQVVSSYAKASKLARESYRGGTGIILDVLASERSLSEGRLALADSLRQLGKDYVSLQVAIGGGAAVTGALESLTTGSTGHIAVSSPVKLPALPARDAKAADKPVQAKKESGQAIAPLRLKRAG